MTGFWTFKVIIVANSAIVVQFSNGDKNANFL